MIEFSQTEKLFFLLDGIVKRDLPYDVKDELTRTKIINARDMAEAMMRDEHNAPRAALVETIALEVAQ